MKRPPTSGTRQGKGSGWGGAAKGAGWGGPAQGEGAWGPANGMGWGGPARGAHPAKPRNLPPHPQHRTDLGDLSEDELRAKSEVWQARIRAFKARCERLRAYRAAVILRAPQRPQPAYICRESPRR